MRTIPRVARCLLPICLLVLSTACGQKGPLYLPDNAPPPGSAAEMPCRTPTCKAMQQKAEAVKAAKSALEAGSAGTTPASESASAPATTEPPASSTATTLELQPQESSQQESSQQAPSSETIQETTQ